MDLQQLRATRAQLLYEFGEIEYERTLHIQRLRYLEEQHGLKLTELQKIESAIENFSEENIEKVLKTE
jgi:hypothetical protein